MGATTTASNIADFPSLSGPGDPRPGGRKHRGRDFAMPFGSPIFAPMGWRLIGQGEDGLSGKWAKVQFGDGSTHSFAHLSRFPGSREGRAGQPIAFSGKDADDRNGHLHTRSWVNGKEIDPAGYFTRFKRSQR